MGRYIGPKNKIARRFGVNLGLKSNPTKVARRIKQKPGVHGPGSFKSSLSTYGKQLQEKQKAKFMYGMRESQFRRYVDEATNLGGDTGVTVHQMLEMRMDNVVYRLGFALTRAQARQMVNHGLFLLNGKKMDIPSHRVSVGDTIELKENKKKKKLFNDLEERLSKHELPSWLNIEPKIARGKVVSLPQEQDFEKVFDVKLIIEFYS